MTGMQSVAKWQKVQLTERSAAQQHFLDLCELAEHRKPAEADPTGEWFTFERGAAKHGGGDGWSDAWKRAFFGWSADMPEEKILEQLLALNLADADSA